MSTRIRYGKLKNVPEACPVCGQRRSVGPYNEINALLKATFFGWTAFFYKRDPVWKIPQWWGLCGNCGLRDEMMIPEDRWLFNMLGDTDFKGGTIKVPFTEAK